MIQLNPFAISELLIVITYLPLLLFLLIKGETKLSKIFTLHIFSIFIWGISGFLVSINKTPNVAFLIWNISYIGVIFIPVFFYHAVLLLTKKRSKFFLSFTYLQAVCFSILTLSNQLTVSVRYVFDSFYWTNGTSLYLWSFIAWIIIASTAHLELIFYYRECYPQEKQQIKALMLSIIGFVGGSLNFLPTMGIEIYPYGNFAIPIHSIVVTYAIFKHHLLNIEIIIKKSIVYTLLLLLISIIYLIIVLLIEKSLQNIVGYQSTSLSVSTAFIIGILFFPLKNKIQALVDRFFFKGTREEISLQNLRLRQEIAQSEKYKTLGTMASGIAHEVKNPLTAIKTFCEYLPQKLDDKEFLKKFSRLVGHEVERIDEMVHELLNYGKPAPLALKKTDVHKLIEDTLAVLNSRFIKQNIRVVKNLTTDHRLLTIDQNQIRQALLNIFLNSLDAMPNGGSLTVGSRIKGPSIPIFEISIRDTGCGIAPSDLKQVFDPFFSTKDHGTGLGLPIVQGIVEQHRGKITIESKAGVGTEVRLEFPLTG